MSGSSGTTASSSTLVWRDMAVRYKQTSIGVTWAMLQPFLTMVVFSARLRQFGNVPSNGVPYPIFVYSALLPWTYFARRCRALEHEPRTNRGLVTKVYFPRILCRSPPWPCPSSTSFSASSSSSG